MDYYGKARKEIVAAIILSTVRNHSLSYSDARVALEYAMAKIETERETLDRKEARNA